MYGRAKRTRRITYNNMKGNTYMPNDTTQKGHSKKDRSLTATGIVIAVIAVLLLSAYYQLNAVLRDRSLSRLEEGVNTVITEVTSKLARDSRILNAAASIISQADNFDA